MPWLQAGLCSSHGYQPEASFSPLLGGPLNRTVTAHIPQSERVREAPQGGRHSLCDVVFKVTSHCFCSVCSLETNQVLPTPKWRGFHKGMESQGLGSLGPADHVSCCPTKNPRGSLFSNIALWYWIFFLYFAQKRVCAEAYSVLINRNGKQCRSIDRHNPY